MIPAAKKPLVEKAMAVYNRRLLRKQFHALWINGEAHVADLDRAHPIVLFGNHSSWWDPLVNFYCSHSLFRFDGYAMMEEKQLTRYGFFRWIGVFSVRRESPRDAVASLRYAGGLFGRPNRALWIYPQGIMLPADVRPLGFQTGIGRLAQMLSNAQFIPFVHRFEFVGDQKPEAFAQFGQPFRPVEGEDFRAFVRGCEERVVGMLDTLRARIARGDLQGFRNVLPGSASISTRWDRVRLLEDTP